MLPSRSKQEASFSSSAPHSTHCKNRSRAGVRGQDKEVGVGVGDGTDLEAGAVPLALHGAKIELVCDPDSAAGAQGGLKIRAPVTGLDLGNRGFRRFRR